MYDYPLQVHNDSDGLWVKSADVARMYGVGDTLEQALESALDGMETAFSLYVEDGESIPAPGAAAPGDVMLHLPVLVAAKVVLWNAFVTSGMSKAELARRMGVPRPGVDRLMDFLHHSKIEQVERALAVLGQRVGITVQAA